MQVFSVSSNASVQKKASFKSKLILSPSVEKKMLQQIGRRDTSRLYNEFSYVTRGIDTDVELSHLPTNNPVMPAVINKAFVKCIRPDGKELLANSDVYILFEAISERQKDKQNLNELPSIIVQMIIDKASEKFEKFYFNPFNSLVKK